MPIRKRVSRLLLPLSLFLTSAAGWATTYPVTDSFSGSGALSPNWTNTTAAGEEYVALAQTSGTVAPSVSDEQGLAIYSGATFTNDQYAQATFVKNSWGEGGSTGVCVRMSGSGSGVCYLAEYGVIYALVDGAGSYGIANDCPIPSTGDTMQLIVAGVTYTCKDVTTGASASGNDGRYSLGNPGTDGRK